MVKPILSIIIVSYNTADITINCLRSIFKDKRLTFDLSDLSTGEIPAEIIVIDNASADNSVSLIKKLKKPIRIIQNTKNLGFGKANNQGIKVSIGNYILLLNSDTIIVHSSISQCLNWLSSHPEAGICTAQLLNTNKTIQATGGFFPNLLNVFTWSTGLDDLPLTNQIIKPFHPHTPNFYTHDSFYQKNHQQDWVTGAFMLLRRSLLAKPGLFDPNFFMYSEEVEWLYRIKKSHPNMQTWYLIDPQVIHLGGASSQTKSFPILKEYQGVLAFFKKHQPSYQTSLVKIMLRLSSLLRFVLFKIIGQTDKAKIYHQAWSTF